MDSPYCRFHLWGFKFCISSSITVLQNPFVVPDFKFPGNHFILGQDLGITMRKSWYETINNSFFWTSLKNIRCWFLTTTASAVAPSALMTAGAELITAAVRGACMPLPSWANSGCFFLMCWTIFVWGAKKKSLTGSYEEMNTKHVFRLFVKIFLFVA